MLKNLAQPHRVNTIHLVFTIIDPYLLRKHPKKFGIIETV